MPKTRLPYPPEFRRQMVELVRAGRTPEELAKEFEPTAQSIGNWVRQADRDEGLRKDGLTTSEREELTRLRRENKQLRVKRHQADYPITTMCRLLGLSTSGCTATASRRRIGCDMRFSPVTCG
jgi:transposase